MPRLARQRTPEQAERTARIIELRRKRVPVAEIAAELGISSGRVSQLYSRALAEIPAPQMAEHRAEELALADDAVRDLLGIATSHDRSPRTSVEAWSAIRGWAEHKARILGLNAPVKVEVADAVEAEIARLAAELAAVEPGREAAAAGNAAGGSLSEAPA